MERKASTARSDLEQVLVDETAEPKALPLSLLEDITGDFSDDQEIGRGVYAVVYKGILGDRAVAVKKLCDAFMDDKEFHREVECLMRVKHKNVVRFLGYCADRQGNMARYDGKHVMAFVHHRLLCFEYAPKESLDKYIKDARREWGTCYKIIKGICEGLQYLHENRIIHLDLKPANILLDDNMVPKITDFGLSRCFDGSRSQDITKTLLGTMGYFAPEHRERGVISRSTDLYSLGVIIIEILTGQKAHQDTEDVLESWSDRLERSQRDTLCQEIRICYEVALECTEFNPKKRPASAQDIIDWLHEMESIQTAEAASSTSGVAATESKGKSNTDDPVFRFVPAAGRGAHPLAGQTVVVPRPIGPAAAGQAGTYHGSQDDRQEAFAAASSDPVASTSRALAAESKGKSKDEPRVFRSVSASSEPRHGMPQAMAPGQTVAAPDSQYGLIETRPRLPAKLGLHAAVVKIASTYDMVEPMLYLYVSAVKARDLPTMDITGALDPYVEVRLGNFMGVTKHLEKTHNPVWRQTFAFSADHLQSNQLEVIVKDKNTLRDDFVGRVLFDMSDIPSRLLPDNPLAPQWYSLTDAHHESLHLGEIMLAVWFGTQADEAFPDAWHSDAHSLSKEGLTNTRSKVYYSPKLVYLKVSVIAAQDLIAADKGRPLAPTIAKIQMGTQIRRTRPGQPQGSANQVWNEEFMFVASEPFEEPLVVTVEEKVAAGRDEPIGRIIIPAAAPYVPRNDLVKSVPSKWFNLSRGMTVDEVAADATMGIIPVTSPHVRRNYLSRWVHSAAKWFRLSRSRGMSVDEAPAADATTGTKHQEHSETFASKIHLRMSLETAYHVLDESTHYSSDLQPAANKLRKSAIGILSARGLGGNKNPYCVAKYGSKWVRTRTLLGTAAPAWNEQYTWKVFDLSTVITVAVFDNNHLHHADGAEPRWAEEDGRVAPRRPVHLHDVGQHAGAVRAAIAAKDALHEAHLRAAAGLPPVPGDADGGDAAGQVGAAAAEGGGGVHARRRLQHVQPATE